MNNILAKIAIAACLISTGANAASSLGIINATAQQTTKSFSSGMSSSGFTSELNFNYGQLAATGDGSVTYTYLGSNAGYHNSFVAANNSIFFNQAFDNHSQTTLNSSTTQNVVSGVLNFGFSTKSPSYSVTDALNLQANSSGAFGLNQGVFGIASNVSVASQSYQYVLIYNDPVLGGDKDYNDLVVGVNFTPAVPEPETYAMLLAGLGLMGTIARRRNRRQA